MSAQPPYRPPTSPPPGYGPSRPGRGPAIAVAVIVLVIVAGVAYWLGGRNNNSTAAPTAPPAASSPPAASTPASTSASVTPAAAPSASASTMASTAPSAPVPTSAAPTTTKRAPTTSASPSPTVTPFTHPDPDFGYVTAVTTSGSVVKLSFDRATLETGPAAASAAAAHGQTVEDDYYIVNDNPLIRTFELSPSVVVTGSSDLSGEVGPKPSTVAALEAWVKANPKTKLPVDLSYDASGKVTTVAEVFFP